MKPTINAFYDPATSTISYVVHTGPGSSCAIIDSVLDYDANCSHISTQSADQIIRFVRDNRLKTVWLLETHAHADHLSAAPYLRGELGGAIGIGEHIRSVQKFFGPIFNLGPTFPTDGSQFDHLFSNGETLQIGDLIAQVIYVPGHTLADIAYVFDGAAFIGDTLFMPDIGTARCDFPGGDARTLYASIHRLLTLPDETALYMCHDYPPPHRNVCWQTTVAEQRATNIHVRATISEDEFVIMRAARDATLAKPKLIIPSIQVNICAGMLPHPENNGIRYFKTPLNIF